ncbi:SDR family NAD(P)-dependent oxidoreductase [Chengkuizengella sp. SCS-71B]|uniref:SDR family NAD(P)-dependent oxidoreductase n=1 Tax=Chengkuizengella sp. SCS-71B TaxID=3115290 RepID=UPI0032C21F99
MKNVVVLGATGGIGSEIVDVCLSKGVRTVGFARSKQNLKNLNEKLDSYKSKLFSYYAGDAFHQEELNQAVQNADVIIHSMSLPYSQWEQKLLKLADHVIKAAASTNAKVVVIDNIHPYGKSQMKLVSEEHPKQPHTKKGKLRLQMEELMMNNQDGVQVLFARLPDFYGPTSSNSVLNYTLDGIAKGKSTIFIGKKDVPREFIYLPDAAKAVVELAQHDHAYGENWNIPSAGLITGKKAIEVAQKEAGNKTKVNSIGKNGFRILGLFNKEMRETIEMLYLTESPLVLSGDKYEQRIGQIPKTPYNQGISETIKALIESKK